MNEAWSIGVFFKMFSNAKGVLGETTVAAKEASKALNQHTQAMGGASSAASSASGSFKNAANSIAQSGQAASRSSSAYMALGNALRTVGKLGSYAALGTAVVGIKGAANLQDAMNQTQLASKMNPAQMARFHTLAMQMSSSTAQSVSDSMELIRTLATSGINDPKQLAALAMPIARFADTQYLGKNHVAFTDSAATAAKIAHMLNARSASQLTPVLDQLYKMSNDMPDSLKTAATQLKQFAPMFMAQGVDAQTILNLQATNDRVGLGTGYGGTGLAQILNVLKNPSKKGLAAQRELGMIDSSGGSIFINRKSGKFDPLGLMQFINEASHKATNVRDFQVTLDRAFQSQGARREMHALSSDSGIAMYHGVVTQQKGMANVQQAQAKLMASLNNQSKLLITNFSTLATELAFPFLESLTQPVHALAVALGDLAMFVHNHTGVAKVAGGIVGAAGLYGAYNVAKMAGNFAGIGFDIAKHGVNARVFAGHHNWHGPASMATHGGGGRFLAELGGAFLETASMKSTRGFLGGIGRGIASGPAYMGVTDAFKSGFMRDMGLGLRGIPGIGQLISGFEFIGKVLSRTGLVALRAGGVLGLLGEGLAKFGLKAIPVVGEILMLIDTIKFLGSHSKEIGKILADVAHWIVTTGGPMVIKAFTDIVSSIYHGLVSTFSGLFNGGHGGLFDSIRDGITSFKNEWAKQDASNGSRSGATPSGGGHHVNINNPHIHLPPGSSKEHASLVLDHIVNMSNQALRTVGGSGTSLQHRLAYGA